MDYESYLIKENLLEQVEEHFPFVRRPPVNELPASRVDYQTKKIIEVSVSRYVDPELSFDGVMMLHNKFSIISEKTVEWIFPSLLRMIIKEVDTSHTFYWYLTYYFENIDLSGVDSAYRFSWLSSNQVIVLQRIFEYISTEYQIPTHEAQKALRTLKQMAA